MCVVEQNAVRDTSENMVNADIGLCVNLVEELRRLPV